MSPTQQLSRQHQAMCLPDTAGSTIQWTPAATASLGDLWCAYIFRATDVLKTWPKLRRMRAYPRSKSHKEAALSACPAGKLLTLGGNNVIIHDASQRF